MSSFPQFPALPLEIQIQIWRAAITSIPPRIIIAYPTKIISTRDNSILTARAATPGLLQACSLSRKLAAERYHRDYFCVPPDFRKVWVDALTDIVDLGDATSLGISTRMQLEPMRHIRICGEYENFWFPFDVERFLKLRNLEQLQVVCLDGVGNWRTEWSITVVVEGEGKLVMLDKNEEDEKNGLYLSRVDNEFVVQHPSRKRVQTAPRQQLS